MLDGKLVDFPGHLARLRRSLAELDMPTPVDDAELEAIHRELVARNGVAEGMVYLQVTRGGRPTAISPIRRTRCRRWCSSPRRRGAGGHGRGGETG